MNINLPTYFSNEFLFGKCNQTRVLAFFCFFFAFILITYSYVVLSKGKNYQEKKIKRNKKFVLNKVGESEDIGGKVYQDALRILDKARSDSLRILGRAQARAQGLLDNTYTISQENRKQLDQNLSNIYEKQERSLQNLSEDLLESYRNAVEEGKQENIRTLYEATEAMRKEALSGVDEFKDVMKKETTEAQYAIEQKIKTEYSKIDEELRVYKENKIKSLNNKIFDLLSEIYTEVINEDLDQVKYEKLILGMLQEEINKSGISYESKSSSKSESDSN